MTYIAVYLGAMFLALLLTPLAIRLALRMGLVDAPNVRKVHAQALPRIGGLAIAGAMLGTIVPLLFLNNAIGEYFCGLHMEIITLLASSIFILLLGLLDDMHNLRPRTKLFGQMLGAGSLCMAGISINSLDLPGLCTLQLGWLAWPLTMLWIVGLTNAVNLIDGLDGLAAGISAITCGVIAVLAVSIGQPVMAVLMLALLGSLTGFLRYNFCPARIFMGDCGSQFLGFLLAGSSVLCAAKSATVVALALPALALGIPIFDTLFSMLRRLLQRRSLSAPDRGHIHHRLLSMGLNHKHAVVLLYVATGIVAALGMFMLVTHGHETVVVFACVLLLLLLLFRAMGSVRLNEVLASLRRNMRIAAEEKQDRSRFESAELLMGEAADFDDWLGRVCIAAEWLDFAWLTLKVTTRDGMTRTLSWHHRTYRQNGHPPLELTVPVRDRRAGQPLEMQVAVIADDLLETAGRRAALFSRLMDEFSVALLKRSGARAAAAAQVLHQ